ncbi:3'-5' exonuclease [Cytophaga sp. FL35]|uniref:3'-5' exonuclease n=1 Tax=Cytophaga sp. FL35 TaxID=1904456 RepID=UPI001653A79D|nr:3'-5' exonuclease [Cytophaga sp. FL35]MBC6998062.1 3'-5' exonuclease [Cytophaga sp. FL35]
MINWFKKKRKINYPDFWESYARQFNDKLSQDLNSIRFVVLDTETTGFDYENDRVLSIGALSLKNSTIIVNESFEVFLDQHFYHAKNVEIHGILKDGKQDRITELEALMLFLEFIGNAVLVAHHARFDINMINHALKRHGMPKLKNKVLDTSVLFKKSLIATPLSRTQEAYTLDYLADKFDISTKDRHTALGDAYITAIAFLKILVKLKAQRNFSVKKLLR